MKKKEGFKTDGKEKKQEASSFKRVPAIITPSELTTLLRTMKKFKQKRDGKRGQTSSASSLSKNPDW